MNNTAPKLLIAFHGDASIQTKYQARIAAHAAADEIANGFYWQDGKGCAVGCTIHGDNHYAYETELGIPAVLARLEDRIFESLFKFDTVLAKAWPMRFINAPQLGADLTLVWPKFALWVLADPEHGMIRHAKKPETITKIENVIALYREWSDGCKPAREKWLAALAALDAVDAVDALAAVAALAAVDALAALAAVAALDAVDAVDALAAVAALDAVDAVDALAAVAAVDALAAYRSAFYRRHSYWPRWAYYGGLATQYLKGREQYVRMADKLIELMQAAPVSATSVAQETTS